MFAAQLVGMLTGCVLAPATFQMFVAGQPNLGEPGTEYPAPFAQVYRNLAVVGVGGTGELGKNCLWVPFFPFAFYSLSPVCLLLPFTCLPTGTVGTLSPFWLWVTVGLPSTTFHLFAFYCLLPVCLWVPF